MHQLPEGNYYYAPQAGENISFKLSEDVTNFFFELGEVTDLDLYAASPSIKNLQTSGANGPEPILIDWVDRNVENPEKDSRLFFAQGNNLIAQKTKDRIELGQTQETGKVMEVISAWLVEDLDTEETFVVLDEGCGEIRLLVDSWCDPTREDPCVYLPTSLLDLEAFEVDRRLQILSSPY